VNFHIKGKKREFMMNKRKYKDVLIEKKVSVFDDITKPRRALLQIVRSKYKSGHTRSGEVAFYKDNNLVFVKRPNDLFSHGFDVEEIERCEKAFLQEMA
jgi:hypothetical protein